MSGYPTFSFISKIDPSLKPPADHSVALANSEAVNNAIYSAQFQGLYKSANPWITPFDDPRIPSNLRLGVSHFQPLNPKIEHAFNYQTGGTPYPWEWRGVVKKYSSVGE